jgi:hypothetical protein
MTRSCRTKVGNTAQQSKLFYCLLKSSAEIAGSDVVLNDVSDVNRLVSPTVDIIDELGFMGLNPFDVLQTFRAITESTLSPRGAILRDALVYNHSGRSVPFSALAIMSEKNLIEIRNGNPDVLDYPELAPFAAKVYLCATRPRARQSMLEVIMALTNMALTNGKGK